jgi:hypothetical protein
VAVVGSPEEIAEEDARARRDARRLEADRADEAADAVGADMLQHHVGGGVVAARDHGVDHRPDLHLAREVGRVEDRRAGRPDALVEGELLGQPLVELRRLDIDVLEEFGEHEGLERAAAEQRLVGVIGRPEGGLVARGRGPDLERLPAWQLAEPADDALGQGIAGGGPHLGCHRRRGHHAARGGRRQRHQAGRGRSGHRQDIPS